MHFFVISVPQTHWVQSDQETLEGGKPNLYMLAHQVMQRVCPGIVLDGGQFVPSPFYEIHADVPPDKVEAVKEALRWHNIIFEDRGALE